MNVKLLGGAGAVGIGVAKDLLRNPALKQLVLADVNESSAQSVVEALKDERTCCEAVDAGDPKSLAKVMDSEYVIANCIGPHYRYCRQIADAAVEAGANYCDICDDYDAAESVFDLDQKAKAANITLITCLGTSPGVTNMLAKRGSEFLDETGEIHTYWTVGGSDPTGPSELYHLAHIVSDTVPQFLDGKWEQVPALSGTVQVAFPEPVGKADVSYIGHSEPVTLPRFIQGVNTVTNRGGLYPPQLNDLIRLAREIGLFADSQLTLKGVALSPRDFSVAHFRRLLEESPEALGVGEAQPISVFRVEIRGKKQGNPCEVIYTGTNEVVTTTARSLSIGIQMLGEKRVRQTGAMAPEGCLPTGSFFEELADGGGVTLREEIRYRSALITR
jgi:saccharopine dehydrogenase-like NADP-dependent oxidoreductase